MDAIILNGKTYTKDKLNELPDPLKLENIFIPSQGGITGFFMRNSPLSNFYLCSFEVQNPVIPKYGTISVSSEGSTV